MWDCLVKLSTWVEGNSGQIQILIGTLALGLAIFGFRQIIEQINIAKKTGRSRRRAKKIRIKDSIR